MGVRIIGPIGVVAAGVLGLFAGGGVWVVARAQALERPLLFGPACAACGAAMPARGWLPLMGGGGAVRCGACGARQTPTRPVFEVLVAAYFALAAARLGFSLGLAAALVFALPLLLILLVDLWTRYVHLGVVVAGTLAGLGFALVEGPGALVFSIGAALGGAAIFGVVFFLAAALYRDLDVVPFGGGDVYLVVMIGAMTGFPGAVRALVVGIILAGVAGLVLLASRRAGRHDVFAYGPFLCLGALLAMLLQD